MRANPKALPKKKGRTVAAGGTMRGGISVAKTEQVEHLLLGVNASFW